MSFKAISVAVVVASAMFLAATATWAGVLPPAAYYASVDGTYVNQAVNQPGSVSAQDCTYGYGCASNSATVGENLADVEGSSSGGFAGPSASVTYYVQVDGPPGVSVPLHLVANLASSASKPNSSGPTAEAFAGIRMSQSVSFGEELSIGGNGFETCAGGGCAAGQCFGICPYPIGNTLALDTTLSLPSDTPEVVILFARCGIFVGGASCRATADPMFSIDHTFLATHPGYSLQFSQGIINTIGSVPEPSTWAMMLLGVSGLGGAMRSRRRGVPSV